MSLDTAMILDRICSHALTLGVFERVNTHEPKSAPQAGLTAAVWTQSIHPIAMASGLDATSVRIVFTLRIYSSMLQEPQDAIDPSIVTAVDAIMNAYSGDFDLDGTIRNVDLLGQFGIPMQAMAGYLAQDNRLYRVMDISLPLVINDVWTQEA